MKNLQRQNKQQPEKQNTTIQRVVQHELYSGPLPHPEQLEAFEKVCPGAADRIISMAERENTHRHRKEALAINGTLFNERMGTVCAFLIATLAIGGGIYCISSGHSIAGSVLGGVPLVTIVIAFIRGRWNNQDK